MVRRHPQRRELLQHPAHPHPQNRPPPDNTSNDAHCFAVCTGGRYPSTSTVVPRWIRSVHPATNVNADSASIQGMSAGAAKLPSSEYGYRDSISAGSGQTM